MSYIIKTEIGYVGRIETLFHNWCFIDNPEEAYKFTCIQDATQAADVDLAIGDDYVIMSCELVVKEVDMKDVMIQQALAKLTDADKQLLGL